MATETETADEVKRQAADLVRVNLDGRIVLRTGPLTMTPEGARAVAARILELLGGNVKGVSRG